MSSLPPPAKSTIKRKILTAVQVLVTAGILAYVFHDPDKRAKMWQAITHAKPVWLLLGFLSYGVVEVLASGRWYLLMRVQGIRLKMWRLGALFMLGIFFNMFMPGGTGGDVLKVFYLIKEIPDKKAKGLLAVLMDRLIGLMALIMISGIIIGIRYDWLKTDPMAQKLTWLLLLILLSGLGGIIFSFLISGFNLAHKLPHKMPMRDALIDSSVAYNAYARAWPASLLALFASFGVHFASFSVFICAARALSVTNGHGDPLPISEILSVMPIILTLSALPVSVGGTGVREAIFVALLVPLCGVSSTMALTLSLTGWMLSAFWGIIGGIIFLLYRPSEHAKMVEAELRVHELGHEIAEHAEEEEDEGEK
jgi:uncharacterized protein (TIRG00374 family)